MAGYTYTTLKQAIQDYTDNQETVFVTNLDNFIRAAEERVLKEAPLQVFRKNAYAALTDGQKYMPKPSDWLFTYSCSIKPTKEAGDHAFLLNKDVSFIQEYWPDPTETEEPKYYADFDIDNFILAPTPDGDYYIELHYFYRPVSIVDATDGETWLGTNAGPALLYGSLVEAYTFMKGEADMIQSYEQYFQRALSRITAFSTQAEGLDFYRRPNA